MKPVQLFTDYYESVQAWARGQKQKRTADALRKTMASDERLLDLSDKVARARETKRFLEDGFWIDRLEPFIRSKAVLKPAVVKDGDLNPVDRINVQFLIGSGRVGIIKEIIEELEDWQKQGAEAEKILLLEAEKKKRLREAGA